MNQLVGTWTSSSEMYGFDTRGVYYLKIPNKPMTSGKYRISGNKLTLLGTYDPKRTEEIALTFSDNRNKVRFDWIDGTERAEDGAKSICLRRE